MGEAPSLDDYPDTPLKLAMLQRGVSVRSLARRLRPDGTEREIDNARKDIRDWLRGAQPRTANARRLAEALELPENYFLKETPSRQSVRREIDALWERIDAIEVLVRERLAAPPRDSAEAGQRRER